MNTQSSILFRFSYNTLTGGWNCHRWALSFWGVVLIYARENNKKYWCKEKLPRLIIRHVACTASIKSDTIGDATDPTRGFIREQKECGLTWHTNRFMRVLSLDPMGHMSLAAAMSTRCSTETKTIRRTIPTALGSYHQPGQRASAC